MRRPRSERMPVGSAGIWHITSRCVRRERLLEGPGCREWLSERLASWLEVLAVDLLGYALMGNHVHLVVRTRPDVAHGWSITEVRRRWFASMTVSDGAPSVPAVPGPAMVARAVAQARLELAHPRMMLRAVKEGFARRLNRVQGASGHVWESRYHDVAVVDAGGVLACLVYVDLNPLRAGLVTDPAASTFCSARHRIAVDRRAADAALAAKLCRVGGHPLLDVDGAPRGAWSWDAKALAELTATTATIIQGKATNLPPWAEAIMPRLGISREAWSTGMSKPGTISGNVIGAYTTRRALAGTSRMASDKSGLFGDGE
jgi:hypothetical protein